jgi:hypothetical protein
MKKIITSVIAVALLSSFTLLPGDCKKIIFFTEGTSTTMTSYNDDGKITGSTKTLYSKVTKTASGASVLAHQDNYDKKGKLSTSSDFSIKCDNGVLVFDMKMAMPQQQQDAYKDMEMTMEGNNLEYPSELVVGNSLKDADVKFTFKTKDGVVMPMSNLSIKISNRKIEAKESVTTPAGTFECFKLSEFVETKTLFTIKAKSIVWFNQEVGTVKTESYKESGKFLGKSELTELKK